MPSDTPLKGLRVLVTRPERQAGKWQALLQQQGANIVRAPLMEIEAFAPEHPSREATAIIQRLNQLNQYQHLIFVSQNAAHYGMLWIEHCQAQISPETSSYAVGSATAQQLQNAGLKIIAAGNTMNTEALLALPQLHNISEDRILILRGQGGRPTLATVLEERGARVDYLELYRRLLPPATAQQLQHSDWGQSGDIVALHSGESLSNWHKVIEQLQRPQWHAIPVLVPGARVQQLAQSLGFSTIITAHNATDIDMSRTLALWYRNS